MKLTIRPFEAGDLTAIFEMNRRASAKFKGDPGHYFFPDPRDGRNQNTLVAVDTASGQIVGYMIGRITAELQLVIDNDAVAARSRLPMINRLWEGMKDLLWSIGIADVHAPVAPWHKGLIREMGHKGKGKRFHYGSNFMKDDRINFTYNIRADKENK